MNLSIVLFYFALTGKTLSFQLFLGGEPHADQLVELLHVAQDVKPIEQRKTDSKGLVRFQVDENKFQQVVALRQESGLSYFSALVNVASTHAAPYKIETFATTTSSETLQVESLGLSFEQRARDLHVEESLQILNAGNKTAIGQSEIENAPPEVFRFSLPNSAFNLRYGAGFQQGEVEVQGNDILILRPLTPGRHFFSLQYSLEQPHFTKEINRRFSIPLRDLEISTNREQIKPMGLNFEEKGRKIFSDQDFFVFQAKDLNATELQFSLSGLPANIPFRWWLPAILFLVLMACAFGARSWIRALRLEVSTEAQLSLDPKEKQKLLSELKKLEKLYEARLVSSEDYSFKKLRILENLAYYY